MVSGGAGPRTGPAWAPLKRDGSRQCPVKHHPQTPNTDILASWSIMGKSAVVGSALVLALALAGCSGGKAKEAPAAVTGDETHGVLIGLVTDDESQPVIEATIALKAVKAAPIQIKILSNSEGRFRLDNVPQGRQT